MIKFYEKMYYGYRFPSGEDLPLAFATPFENNAAFKKRKETVDTWSGHKGTRMYKPRGVTGLTFDNVPMKGFSVAGVVSRWSTSNKLYRVDDPRGFQLEISADNLLQLIDQTTIVKGVFEDELVWGRKAGTNVLWPTDSEEYQEYLNPVDYTHEPGDMVTIDTNYDKANYVYVGKKYVHIITKDGDEGVDPKPFHVYFRKVHNSDMIFIRRSAYKKDQYKKYEGDESVPEYDLSGWNKFYSSTNHSYISVCRFLDKKEKVDLMNDSDVKTILEKILDIKIQ